VIAVEVAASPDGLRLRPVEPKDRAFLLALYHSVRAPDLIGCRLSRAQEEAFVAEQFRLQHAHYQRAHPTADYWVVERLRPTGRPEPIGRLSLDRSMGEWRLLDLSLVPRARGRGVGTALLRWVQGDAVAAGADAVDLHVEVTNTAASRLYLRLGFRRSPSRFASHDFLRWTPPELRLDP
jgi:ribosomal protein S18 acetylase RimI-like enzyme